ncbi:hypothetical protein Scep_009707 [Stephania cephalantha]|uniref:Uncharacterized protein n=1 Tax=Stephania cephalantha TaxID=152367 RepID=A0AAP0JU40_9MAGN
MSSSAAASNRVAVHSKLTVVSDTPIDPGKTYPLSTLDHAMALHTLHLIFYYRYDRRDDDLGRLRHSLAEVLSQYPPVTGRLRRRPQDGNWEIKCNDAGVRVLKAKVAATLDEWLSAAAPGGGGCEEMDLAVWEDMPDEPNVWSPFRVQMNDFEGGGLAIGLSCPHMHADPTCATFFMKSWTDMYRQASLSHPPFFHPPGLRGRETPKTNTKSAKYYESKSKMETPVSLKMSTATFRFSEKTIKNLLSDIHNRCPDATPFEVLAALFWSSISNFKTHVGNQPCSSISICIDIKKRMYAPLPHGFFGNALHFSRVSCNLTEMHEGVLDHLTAQIHDHLSNLDEEEFWSAIEWLESKKSAEGQLPPPFTMYGPELTFANLEHVQAYAAMLGNSKPVHVSYHVGGVNGEGLVLVLPSPEDGLGRTVMVTLPEGEATKLCEDQAILQLEPTILLTNR